MSKKETELGSLPEVPLLVALRVKMWVLKIHSVGRRI